MLMKVIVFGYLLALIKNESKANELKSKLNKYELENIKYDLDIDNKLMSDEETHYLNYMPIKTNNGQTYFCQLPDYESIVENDDEVHLDGRFSREKKEHLDESDDEEAQAESSWSSMFFETSSPILNSKKHPKPQINFTLVNEKVKAYMARLNESNLCLYKNLGWWTYEFCFGKYASQYHILNNGSIEGEKIRLGNFSSDYDWLKANMTTYPTSSGVLYHEQYYETGSLCELNGRPRRSIVKIFCDELGSNYIDLISEVETCVYEIHVNSFFVCSVPQFRKAPQNLQINCNPVVSNRIYEMYKEKKAAAVAAASAAAIAALTATDSSPTMTTMTATRSAREFGSSASEPQSEKFINDLKVLATTVATYLYDNPELFEMLEKEIIEEVSNGLVYDDSATLVSPLFDTNDEGEVEIDQEDDDNQNEDQAKAKLEEKQRMQLIKNELKEGKDVLNDLKNNAGEYEKAIKNLKKQKEGDVSKAREEILDALKAMKNKHASVNKVLENVGGKISEMVSNKAGTLDEKKPLSHKDETKNNELKPEQDQVQDKLASLERTLEERLAKSAKLSEKLKSAGGEGEGGGGGEIKVKIIAFDAGMDALADFNDDESSSLNEFLTSLLNGQSDRVKALKSSYDSVYTENTIDDLVRTQENGKADAASRQRRAASNHFDDSGNFFFSLLGDFDDSPSSDDSDNDNEKLIIF